MALTPIEALNKVMDDRVASTRITSARTLANMAQANRVMAKRDTKLNWDVDLGGEAAGEGLITADTTVTATGNVVPATLSIGAHRIFHRFNISRVAIQEAATVAPAELQNLFGEMVDRGLNAIARKLNDRLYTGVGTDATSGIYGFQKILDNTSAYAGIDPATHASWVSLQLANAGTPRAFTRNLMLDMDELVANKETYYDMVITNPATAKSYVKVFDTIAGSYAVVNPTAEQTGLKRADLGHGGRFFNGFPIIEDTMCPAGQILLLKSSDITLYCFELDNTPNSPGAISDIVINRSYGIPVHIAELPSSNSAIRTFEFYVIPQLRAFDRRSVMAILDLS